MTAKKHTAGKHPLHFDPVEVRRLSSACVRELEVRLHNSSRSGSPVADYQFFGVIFWNGAVRSHRFPLLVIQFVVSLLIPTRFLILGDFDFVLNPEAALNFDLSTVSRYDSDHALDSNFDPTPDFDLGLILDSDRGLDFNFYFSSFVQFRFCYRLRF
ncbi:hypothetical protein EVAR_3775_1 [Eumeta japonica]|uniref:Uncharacterized protein n=1 Tax=Eumeta variegata TaxID=151549 RepID=A0A4C1SRX4_EUMVA|nr:hypothetical protein EVAR_3775_1 [Eumeta japonica]